jgi:hypothetical protein
MLVQIVDVYIVRHTHAEYFATIGALCLNTHVTTTTTPYFSILGSCCTEFPFVALMAAGAVGSALLLVSRGRLGSSVQM